MNESLDILRTTHHLSDSVINQVNHHVSHDGVENTYEVANLTSTGFTDAALTLISSSSGLVIFGTGNVPTLYSAGLQNFVRAIARIVVGILVVMMLL